ncbi:PhoH family protein [bacterium]|nr:PhoH family protein [bacterium]
MSKSRLQFENGRTARSLFCNDENNLELIENAFDIKITARDNFFVLKGRQENIEKIKIFFSELKKLLAKGAQIHQTEFTYLLEELSSRAEQSASLSDEKIEVPGRKKIIIPKTEGQIRYIQAIRSKTAVFGIGPAGTGKTYLAMAMAVSHLKSGIIRRIILTRPAVEAGESLGFLPGDLYDKILPYLRPLYDALHDMITEETLKRYRDRGIIEIVPLAYMRGRTLNDAFIILDEAQNATIEQMRMFLTRLGFRSKAVVTGDITQIDLPSFRRSGLVQVQSILKKIDDIEFIYFNEKDVVRHELVSKIIKAYEKYDELKNNHEKNTDQKKINKKSADKHAQEKN